jgi:hypothetical protein
MFYIHPDADLVGCRRYAPNDNLEIALGRKAERPEPELRRNIPWWMNSQYLMVSIHLKEGV